MDVLHRKVCSVGDQVFFLVSSIANPYIYLRMSGIVEEVSYSENSISYRIRCTDILETADIILKYFHLNRFRIKSVGKKRKPYIDKKIYLYDVPKSYIRKTAIDKYVNYWFDVSSMLVFPSEDDMFSELEIMNKWIVDSLAANLKKVTERISNLQ